MSEMNTRQIVVQENGVLIPNELFGKDELVIDELKKAGVFCKMVLANLLKMREEK